MIYPLDVLVSVPLSLTCVKIGTKTSVHQIGSDLINLGELLSRPGGLPDFVCIIKVLVSLRGGYILVPKDKACWAFESAAVGSENTFNFNSFTELGRLKHAQNLITKLEILG